MEWGKNQLSLQVPAGVAIQKRLHLILVFGPKQRAGRIGKRSPPRQHRGDTVQDFGLSLLDPGKLVRRQAPLAFRVAPPAARAGTGRVDQDQIVGRTGLGPFGQRDIERV